jgi:hypothetical protein
LPKSSVQILLPEWSVESELDPQRFDLLRRRLLWREQFGGIARKPHDEKEQRRDAPQHDHHQHNALEYECQDGPCPVQDSNHVRVI